MFGFVKEVVSDFDNYALTCLVRRVPTLTTRQVVNGELKQI